MDVKGSNRASEDPIAAGFRKNSGDEHGCFVWVGEIIKFSSLGGGVGCGGDCDCSVTMRKDKILQQRTWSYLHANGFANGFVLFVVFVVYSVLLEVSRRDEEHAYVVL